MKFQSTRGANAGLSFQDVVMSGYAPDDGMYMPMEIPQLSQDTLAEWSQLPYKEIAKEISKLYIGDEIPAEKISELMDVGFSTFEDPENPIVTKQLEGNWTFMEMYHGKSLAFKDLSMCVTAQFVQYFLEQSDSKAILLISTSGDTGSSALNAMCMVDRVDTVVILPKDRISQVQERQMTTVVSDNCYVIRADGTSDDTDIPIRKVFSDPELVRKYKLGSLNSVNFSRLMLQMAHHFYSYFQGKKVDPEKETLVFIPTGGLGNCTAGCMVRQMGLPIRMVCSVTNDALYRAVYSNDYSVKDLVISLAPAINIQVIYNFERILYLLSDMDTELVKKTQLAYAEESGATTPQVVVEKLKEFFEVVLVTDDDIIEAIKKCQVENDGYLVCPHTATAMAAAYEYKSVQDYNIVIYGVASPAKFMDVLAKAGVEWTGRNLIAELMEKETRYTDWGKDEDWAKNLETLLNTIGAKAK